MQCQSSVQTMMKNTSEQKRKIEGLGFSLFLFCNVNLHSGQSDSGTVGSHPLRFARSDWDDH